jgi:uncharacterized protein YjdB
VIVEDGKVRAMGAGEATISASVKDVKATATITVKLPTVAKVEVTPPSATVDKPGQKIQLKAVAKDAAGETIAGATPVWTSANDKIATVAGDGEVTVVKKGKTKIKVTIGGQSAEAEVGAK